MSIENQFNDLFSSNEVELQRLCLCGFCSKDLKLSCRYGKKIVFMLDKDKLVDYWICEGFIDGNQGRDRAVNQGYEILGTLVRACLIVGRSKGEILCEYA